MPLVMSTQQLDPKVNIAITASYDLSATLISTQPAFSSDYVYYTILSHITLIIHTNNILYLCNILK